MTDQLKQLVFALAPEIILFFAACYLMLLGTSSKEIARRLAPVMALIAVGAACIIEASRLHSPAMQDAWNQIDLTPLAHYFRLIATAVSIPLVLLAWPTNRDATAGKAIEFGKDVPEFFALMLLSISGILLVAAANDIILLFLGIELASIPTYVMVSVSRPISAAQEAGVKYFFLGAMAAALLLFGLSYLYGTTGEIHLNAIADGIARGGLTSWQLMAVLMVLAGFAFKMAAFPMQAYVGDVYQGAATPVTAFLAFVPKTTGFIATLKILWVAGGASWMTGHTLAELIVVVAVLTMTLGNILGLLQNNVKRTLAYSSVAHTGYMLVGVAAMLNTSDMTVQNSALTGVLFYLAAYGIMNAGAFGVLMLLPANNPKPATTAETYEDIAGQGRNNVGLGLAMAVCCFSLTGIPLTVGFLGKFYLIKPALAAHQTGLVIWLMINAAISAGYYLRIVGTMFLRPASADASTEPVTLPAPIALGVGLSVVVTLVFGIYLSAVSWLTTTANNAAPITLRVVATAQR